MTSVGRSNWTHTSYIVITGQVVLICQLIYHWPENPKKKIIIEHMCSRKKKFANSSQLYTI